MSRQNLTRHSFTIVFAGLLTGLFISSPLSARPEYALEQKADCSACHVTPYGGGQRNEFGKTFGIKGFKASKEKLNRDLSIDARMVGYYTKQEPAKRSGIGVMSTIVSGEKALENAELPLSIVAAYDLGMFEPGLREMYIKSAIKSNENGAVFMVGKFQAPFGLMTDEHRSYTRMLTKTTNREFESGANVSAFAWNRFHADVAVVNGYQSGGAFTEGDVTQGAIANLRYTSAFAPIMIGGSYAVHQRREKQPEIARAYAGYAGLTLKNLTGGYVPVTVLAEKVYAKHYTNPDENPYINRYFVPIEGFDNYVSEIQEKEATADLVVTRLSITPKFSLLYKYDRLLLDKDFPGDAYERHGYGIDHKLHQAINLQLRYEEGTVGREGLDSSNVAAARDVFLAVLHVWY